MNSLLIYQITVLLIQLGAAIRVFDLQSAIQRPPRSDAYVRFFIPVLVETTTLTPPGSSSTSSSPVTSTREELSSFSVCYRFLNKILPHLETHWSYASTRTANELLLGREGESIVALLHNLHYSSTDRLSPIMHRWTHWCFLYRNGTFTLYVDGVKRSTLAGPPTNIRLNGTLILGQEQDQREGGFIKSEIFRGYLAHLNLYSSLLDERMIMQLATCGSNVQGDVFSSDQSVPVVKNAAVFDIEFRDLCMVSEPSFSVPTSLSFKDSVKMCHLFGTTIFAPFDEKENAKFDEHVKMFAEGCPGSFWVGVTKVEDDNRWKTLANITVNRTYFEGEVTHAARACAMIVSGGSWLQEHCDGVSTRCFDCRSTYSGTLSLKGLCFHNRIKTLFDVRGYINEKPYFHGLYGYIIAFNNITGWELIDTIANKSLAVWASSSSTDYPVGRTTWKLSQPTCGFSKNKLIALALSKCKPAEFMCSDGNCIKSTRRCNAVADCADQSDEEGCTFIKLPAGYLPHIPPTSMENSQRPLPINISFEIQRFRNIIDAKHSVEIEFLMSITWKDSRIVYNNLKDDPNTNELSEDEMRSIWRPRPYFDNIQGGLVGMFEDKVVVSKDQEQLPEDHNSVEMDTRYAGTSAFLRQVQRYSGSFNCRFDVFQYPLDVQDCDVVTSVTTGDPDHVVVQYVGPTVLHEYVVSDFQIGTVKMNHRKIMKVHFTLHRMPNFIMFSVLLPTIMLQIIGYSTLYIKPTLLQVRLTISLTTLLVLYTLFSQTSSALPRTSYIKMIDIWFFFCITVLFFIIILHVVVDRLEPIPRSAADGGHHFKVKSAERDGSSVKMSTVHKILRKLRRVFKMPTQPGERLLFIARAYAFPLIVLPVTIIFWVTMQW